MRVIHFTHGATDPLEGFGARGTRFLPLADGYGDTHLSCLHMEEGVVFASGEPYSLESATGGIVLLVESDELDPHARGISSLGRIAGQTWPSDALANRTPTLIDPEPIVHFMEESRP